MLALKDWRSGHWNCGPSTSLCALRSQFMKVAHDQAGHQCADCTLSQLLQIAY